MAPAGSKQTIAAAATKYGVDPAILWGLYGTESNFGKNLGPSSAGALGPFQFMPATARSYGIDPYNFTQSANAAAKYLAAYKGRGVAGMLSAYNAGPKGGLQPGYVKSVLANAKSFGSTPATTTAAPSMPQALPNTPTPGANNDQARRALIGAFLYSGGDRFTKALGVNAGAPIDPATFTSSLAALGNPATPVKARVARVATQPTAAAPAGAGPTAHGGYAYPLAVRGKIIGVPYQGTHNLGNWQSDNAVDIAVPIGTPVRSIMPGTVVKISPHPQSGGRFAGDQVTIQGPGGGTFYTHLSSFSVKVGQQVTQGQVIGRSGAANGVAHLHIGRQTGNPLKEFG